jgi:hypothetical protein
MHCQLDLGIWLSIAGFILKTAVDRCLADITHLLLRILPYFDIHCFVLISCTEATYYMYVCTYYCEVTKMFPLPLFTLQLLNSSSVFLSLSSSKDVLTSAVYFTVPKLFSLPRFTASFLNFSHFRFLLHSSSTVSLPVFYCTLPTATFYCTVPRLFLLPLSLHSS